MSLLLLLLLAHALADFPLQGEFLSKLKNKNSGMPFPWQWGMFHHCLIHSGLVFLITQSFVIALMEFISHAVIDHLKCQNKISFSTDQLLHIGCKMLWVILLFNLP